MTHIAHRTLESNFEFVPFSQKSTITNDDNKITLTYERALEYLQTALSIDEIACSYRMYFAPLILKARMDIEGSNQTEDALKQEICEELSNISSTNFKPKNFEELKKLKLVYIAINKKTNELFPLLNQYSIKKRYIFLGEDQIDPIPKYSLVRVSVSNTPSIQDWKIIATDMKFREIIPALAISFSVLHSKASSEVDYQVFSSEIVQETIFIKLRHEKTKFLYMQDQNIHFRCDSSLEQKASFPPRLAPYLNEYKELNASSTPGCHIIKKCDLKSIFMPVLIKNARSVNSTE